MGGSTVDTNHEYSVTNLAQEIQFWELGSNLAQAATNWVDSVYRNQESKPLSCPYFVTAKGGQEQFPGKGATALALAR